MVIQTRICFVCFTALQLHIFWWSVCISSTDTYMGIMIKKKKKGEEKKKEQKIKKMLNHTL